MATGIALTVSAGASAAAGAGAGAGAGAAGVFSDVAFSDFFAPAVGFTPASFEPLPCFELLFSAELLDLEPF